MPKRTRFDDYKDSYANFQFELSDEGILLMRCHTDGGPLVWDAESHDRMADAFADIAGDRDIKVVIHTGTGENYNADWGFLAKGSTDDDTVAKSQIPKGFTPPVEFMDERGWYGRMLIMNLLDIEVPIIAAVNGPCNIHSEVPLLCDIVIASDDATFQDAPHYRRGMVPGDGQHIAWPMVVGPNRARYLMLTGHTLSAQQALEWGAVAEVLPKDRVLERAWELARDIAKRPPMATRYTRMLFTQNFKRACIDELSHGIGLELYAQRQFYPVGGGMGPIKQAWDSDDPMAD
ncbi:enoyl-CoA hydratase/isomerase family protein [Mycobacterium sp. SMC-2]|uniref:enoyl-CoA hydratase/isomerase family protein n=1 Tax=Mycobacterium sp. SMC-2 TaxID=2857058 RepID=UPI0021B2DBE7|nr:enoyl-CoA hydratase/isomerase family protein [Mycobacterium sp. SMC-2]UXA05360.1 enoyl-CoA hydratase/isomerase family protein [Mycobacterium sp. SMC-2]